MLLEGWNQRKRRWDLGELTNFDELQPDNTQINTPLDREQSLTILAATNKKYPAFTVKWA